MNHAKGFSLIELLIVVAIILIIAAIAIPNLLRSRIAAHEGSATSSLRTINTSEMMYASVYNSGFTDNLSKLCPPTSGFANATAADLLDALLCGQTGGSPNGFTKNGYTFVYKASGTYGTIASYTLNADPTQRGSSGGRSFFSDESGVIRFNTAAAANASDSPI